ncbi:MAG TPA: hypothetical protein VGQ17_17805 [Gemmatimonadales bacterium]|jgi:hypothetical protein|nr:hypothetical protein [Gemmatimonadales bacterium]
MAACRAITAQRDTMVTQWIAWLGDRLTATSAVSKEVVRQELTLLIDVFASMVGPLRRETRPIWIRVSEVYGSHAAMRGLAAGEVVEEMQYLRELLIRHLAPAIAALRPRQGMALLLRLNRLVDRGVAMAVVGYTNVLVQSLLPDSEEQAYGRRTLDPEELTRSLHQIRTELHHTISAPHLRAS